MQFATETKKDGLTSREGRQPKSNKIRGFQGFDLLHPGSKKENNGRGLGYIFFSQEEREKIHRRK